MNITHFNDLIQAARQQSTPQHLLLVFAQAELPDDSSPEERARFEAGEGGALTPIMCVDKAAHELPSFEALASEAAGFGVPWHVVFAGALGAPHGRPLGQQDLQQALERMVESVRMGLVGSFATFDRQGHAISLDT
jgi:hypothetical protein